MIDFVFLTGINQILSSQFFDYTSLENWETENIHQTYSTLRAITCRIYSRGLFFFFGPRIFHNQCVSGCFSPLHKKLPRGHLYLVQSAFHHLKALFFYFTFCYQIDMRGGHFDGYKQQRVTGGGQILIVLCIYVKCEINL